MPLRPCLDCGALSKGSRCPTHDAAIKRRRDQRRPSTTERGLGAEHRRQVKALLAETGPLTNCPNCGRPITPKNPITGEHGVARAHGGTEVTGLICRICNSTAGGGIRRR